ncbi:lactonase family protein [Shouchella shacheensis]|uniref:lactonase family protein n=1 Tax=Shouchella shacheensis TaxID=1649580 RepID=UPI00073FD27D|nr:lactonase family protein [Shouchella shacheensis]
MSTFRGYIGTYTKGDSKGVYTFTLDSTSGELKGLEAVAELKDPTYVTVSSDGTRLYSVMKDGEAGGVSAFDINEESGALTLLNKEITPDGGPCHVSVNSKRSRLLSANYHSGRITAFDLEENGSIKQTASTAQHEGAGPNEERQEKAHAHFAGFTPDEKYVVAVDLGTDEVILYKIDNGKLTRHFVHETAPGAGPRHIAFHPTEPYAYIMTELSNEVIAVRYDHVPGSLEEVQVVSTLPEGYEDDSIGSAIHLTKDGRFLYVANRGHNSMASFSVNPYSGELSFVEHVSTEGDWPRDFHLDPSEEFLVASNQESSNLSVYARNKENGKLSLVNANIPVPHPVCVTFAQT